MAIVQKRIRIEDTSKRIFDSNENGKYLWLDIIVEQSDNEKAGNPKAWSNVWIGPSDTPYIPLINAGSSYSYPYVQGRWRNFREYYVKYTSGAALADADKPYLVITGEY